MFQPTNLSVDHHDPLSKNQLHKAGTNPNTTLGTQPTNPVASEETRLSSIRKIPTYTFISLGNLLILEILT